VQITQICKRFGGCRTVRHTKFMVKYRLSAFSDEYSPVFDEQLEGLTKNRVRMMEIRGVDGVNVSDLTPLQAMDVKKKLDASGISVSAVGSPIGKIKITDPMEPHLEKLKQTCETAEILQTKRIRMFSFYMPQGADYAEYRNEVVERMGNMLETAEEFDVQLCHENEKGIYGDTPERCYELIREFDGRLGCVFDPANYVQCGCNTMDGYKLLAPYITYMHIKDAERRGTIVPAGFGIGSVPEILALINNARKGDFILTVEPHLRVFKGLAELENGEKTSLGNAYATSEDAFEAAIRWTRACFPRTCAAE